ncbi:cytidylyltransferase domain-containing protein [Desulfovirgula thermocuniculi]|uniref:acylneuraminate cytidylyltransferase family protein n=1 Tax=Desulfovirgula thermocuniculi TaxID=348842 RepID=UPI0004045D94|nr:acylneuraminate cytidylyltransferase family protein [Desulfovirgula thermocuniculi]
MYENLSVLGFIPARASSKGVPGKNLRPLAGKPLILHTIETARQSGVFDCLLVSTDGEEIARVAREAGAEVPFLRPAELATDTARGIDVLHHAMEWLEERGQKYDCVMVLQPTSPLRTVGDILAALELLVRRDAGAVVSICEVEHHPWWCNELPPDGCMENFLRPGIPANRQELPKYYRLNGAIYLARWDYIRHRDSWFGPRTYAYIMPQERSVDIDGELDFLLAEAILSLGKNSC